MNSHAYWMKYLESARNGIDRPMNGSRTKRIIRDGSSVTLRLHNTDVVTVHTGDSATIRTDGWNTVTTRAFINEHSRAHVWTEKGNLIIRVRNPKLSPSRIQKCRSCHGAGTRPRECYGPSYCHVWFDRPCQHGSTAAHHPELCEHGQPARHALEPVECWQCDGSGRYEYGHKAIHMRWNGEPLDIDSDGYPIGSVQNVTYGPYEYVEPTPIPPRETYGDSGTLLAAALPAMNDIVTCPCGCAADRTLASCVIHLNDTTRWTREHIADWLDTLDLDLAFPVPDTIPAHIH